MQVIIVYVLSLGRVRHLRNLSHALASSIQEVVDWNKAATCEVFWHTGVLQVLENAANSLP
jgi:hypothetical protein